MATKNIDIKNFGIIKDANIDISSLNVFIGSNSSGKSFIAKLIHCFNFKEKHNFENNILFNQFYKNLNKKNKKLFAEINDEFIEYMSNINFESFKIPIKKIMPLIEDIFQYSGKIEKQFDIQLDNLINYDEDNFKIKLSNIVLTKLRNEMLKIELCNHQLINIENDFFKITMDCENILISNIRDVNSSVYDKLFSNILGMIAFCIIDEMSLENSYYIPAERLEIATDRKLLARFIQDRSNISKNQRDILADIQNIDNSKKSEFFKIACELDEEISKFYVDIEDEGLYNDIIYINSKNNKKTSSQALSTSIREIALISIYLKYILKKDDLLIVEEPEAHLHPRHQRIFIKYLVKLMNNGLKILITTHSDYILDQINNFIRLNNFPEEKLSRINYTTEHIINIDDINIYFFKNTSDDSFVCEKIHVDETGFSEENFSSITDELYDETIKIINS